MDISTTGVNLGSGDDRQLGPAAIGFEFSFYGVNRTTFYAGTNGYLTFTSQSVSYGCEIPCASLPNEVIAGYWDDLVANAIWYEVRGEAPERVLLVQFDGRHFASTVPVQLQFKLFEGTNEIQVHYRNATTDGSTTTAGIEDGTGQTGLQYRRDSFSLQNATVRYTLLDVFESTPLKPSNLSGSSIGTGAIGLTWKAPPGDVSTYRVYRANYSGAPLTLVGETSETSYNETGMPPGVRRTYHVVGVNGAGEGDAASITVTSGGSYVYLYPRAAGGPGIGEINVSWTAPYSDGGSAITSYRVYESFGNAGRVLLAEVPATTFQFVHEGLTNGSSHTYLVVPVNAFGENDRCCAATGWTWAAPSPAYGVTAGYSTMVPQAIHVSWGDSSFNGNAAPGLEYIVERSTNGGAWEARGVTAGRTFLDRETYLGATYSYRIVAQNILGQAAASAPSAAIRGIGPGVLAEDAPPADGWTERRSASATGGSDSGYADASVKRNAEDERYADIDVSVEGIALPTLTVYVGQPLPEDVDTQDLVKLDVTVQRRHDPDAVTCLARIGGECTAWSPIDPMDPDGDGVGRAAMSVHLVLIVDGRVLVDQWVTVPILGQIVGGILG